MKKHWTLTVIIAMAILLTGIPIIGCEGEVSLTTASLSEATMALGVDGDSKPVDATDTFSVDTPEIFCSVRLNNAPADTEIGSEWIYVSGELEGVTDFQIDSMSLTSDGTRYIQFSLTRPDTDWPRGDYNLILYIDGKEELSLPFSVR